MAGFLNSKTSFNCKVYDGEYFLYSQNKMDDLSIEYWHSDKLNWEVVLTLEDKYQSISIWQYQELCFFAYCGKIEVRLKDSGKFLYTITKSKLFFVNDAFIEFKRSKDDRKRGDLSLFKITVNNYSRIRFLKDVEKISFFNIGNQLFGSTRNYIESFNENNWKHSFTNLTGTHRAILHSNVLHINNNLFFVITGNQNKGLYVLDVHSGKLLKKFDEVCYEIFQGGDFIYSTKFENVLCRINTQTLTIEEWDCNSLVKSNGFDAIHDHRCAVLYDKFYFTQSIGDSKAKVGILDWNQKDFIYKYEFEPKNGAIGSIQVNDSKMFVHTQDNTLHIFEID